MGRIEPVCEATAATANSLRRFGSSCTLGRMGGFSRQAVIAGFILVAVSSAIVGAIVALAFFKPDPEIIVERVEVEVEPSEPPLAPDQEDLDRLVERYIDISGSEEDWTTSLVEEIGAAVCDGGLSGPAVMQELGLFDDIEQVALNTFVSEVEATCPQGQPTSTTATTIESASSSPGPDVYPPDFECTGRSGREIFDYRTGAEGAQTIEEAVQPFLEDGDTLSKGGLRRAVSSPLRVDLGRWANTSM